MLEIVQPECRSLIARTVIELFRAYSLAYFGIDSAGERATEVLIGGAIIIGQAEGKPFTAGDISNLLGMPRSTVIAKLNIMQRIGMVASERIGRRKVFWNLRANEPDILGLLEKIISSGQRHQHGTVSG